MPGSHRLERVPLLGGRPELIVGDVDSVVTFSPDGERLAYLLQNTREARLRTIGADGTGTLETLATTPGIGGFSLGAGPAWSPDGGSVAVAVGSRGFLMRDTGSRNRVVLVDAATGDMRPATDHVWGAITGVAWLADGSLVVTGTEPAVPNSQLYVVGPDGAVRRLTSDLSSYDGISVARDTGVILTTLGDVSSTVSILDPDTGSLVPVTSGRGRSDGRSGMAWTHDGRFIYSSAASGGHVDLWISNADGSSARQLTSDAAVEIAPTVSPDDQYLVYQAGVDGGLARLSLDGGRPLQLTTEAADHSPIVLPDGTVQYLHRSPSDDGAEPTVDVRRVSIDGGAVSTVGTVSGFGGDPTPDGRYLVGFHSYRIGFMPVDGIPPELLFPIFRLPIGLALHPIDNVLTFLQAQPPPGSLWNQPLDGGTPTLLYQSEGDRIFNFTWSPDGVLAIAHGPAPTDIVMIAGVR
jgi:Tol biopolymer transport system component